MAIADIAADAGEQLAAELRGAGSAASYHDHDVTDPGAWRELVAAVEQTHGPIDVLVNNAGIQVRSVGIEADDDEWAKVIAVNQRGVFLGMRAVIPGHGEKRRRARSSTSPRSRRWSACADRSPIRPASRPCSGSRGEPPSRTDPTTSA